MTTLDIGKVTISELRERLKNSKTDLMPNLKRVLMIEAMKTRNEINGSTPRDTGLLANSNRVELIQDNNRLILRHLNNQVYAAVQHEEMWFRHTVGMAKYVEIPFLLAIDRYSNAILKAMMMNMAGEI